MIHYDVETEEMKDFMSSISFICLFVSILMYIVPIIVLGFAYYE